MKTVCKRLVPGLLALMLLSSTMISSCFAAVNASRFFSRTAVWCTAQGNGKITVDYDIDATGIMDKLGVFYVTFYKEESNGSWTEVKTYDWNNVPSGLTESNVSTMMDRLWYQGVAGARYYAEVGCYAKKGSESSILPQNTRPITAT